MSDRDKYATGCSRLSFGHTWDKTAPKEKSEQSHSNMNGRYGLAIFRIGAVVKEVLSLSNADWHFADQSKQAFLVVRL
jgi:hypothetical protein